MNHQRDSGKPQIKYLYMFYIVSSQVLRFIKFVSSFTFTRENVYFFELFLCLHSTQFLQSQNHVRFPNFQKIYELLIQGFPFEIFSLLLQSINIHSAEKFMVIYQIKLKSIKKVISKYGSDFDHFSLPKNCFLPSPSIKVLYSH